MIPPMMTCEACASGDVRLLDDDFGVWQCRDCGHVFEEPVLLPTETPVIRRLRPGVVEVKPKRWQRPRPKYEDSDGPV